MKEKLERNLLLSQKHLERDPDDPYCLYYMGAKPSFARKDRRVADNTFSALASKDLPLFLEAMTRNLLAFVELLEGRPDESLFLCEDPSVWCPCKTRHTWWRQWPFSARQNSAPPFPLLARSQEFLTSRRTCAKPISARNMRSSTIRNYTNCSESVFRKSTGRERPSNISGISWNLGGKDPEVARRAGVCCVNAGDFASGLKYLEEAEKLGMARSELALPMALASVQLKDFTRAELLLKEAEKNSPLDTDKIRQIRDLLASESLNGAPRHCQAACDPPGVSLCMIVKDEQERISGCLESVNGLVDEIIVVDTGSGDRTKEIARSCGAKVFSFPWTGNFAEARNESLRHATGDWIIFLDADERLNTFGAQDCLRKAASSRGWTLSLFPLSTQVRLEKPIRQLCAPCVFLEICRASGFRAACTRAVDQFLIESGARTGPR